LLQNLTGVTGSQLVTPFAATNIFGIQGIFGQFRAEKIPQNC